MTIRSSARRKRPLWEVLTFIALFVVFAGAMSLLPIHTYAPGLTRTFETAGSLLLAAMIMLAIQRFRKARA